MKQEERRKKTPENVDLLIKFSFYLNINVKYIY